MPAVSVQIHGFRQQRQQVRRLRAGLSRARTDNTFTRRAIGSYFTAGVKHTPSPLRTQDPQRLVRNRTGFLISTFSVRFRGNDILQLRWGAPYASYVNQRGFSAGYVQRTARDGGREFRRYIRREQRLAARRAARGGT